MFWMRRFRAHAGVPRFAPEAPSLVKPRISFAAQRTIAGAASRHRHNSIIGTTIYLQPGNDKMKNARNTPGYRADCAEIARMPCHGNRGSIPTIFADR